MVRNIAILIGAGFVAVLAWALFWSIQGVITDPPAAAVTEEFYHHPEAPEGALAFPKNLGLFASYDNRQLQRGLQVYKEVCSNCHSLKHVAFRDLTQIGYSAAQVKKFAADWGTKAKQFDAKSGDSTDRPNTPADYFPLVYYPGTGNPPDLSLIAKARHGGADYVYSLLTGYRDQPGYKNEKGEELLKAFPDAKTPDGLYFNPYFTNLNIAMPPPLTQDGQVTYLDGTKSTVKQNAADVAAFLTWAAEPTLVERHQVGLAVLAFLVLLTVLSYGAYQNIWRDLKH